MRTKLAAACFALGIVLAPIAANSADSDNDRSSVKDFAKNAVITTKIKTKLAEERLSSTVRIKVDTDRQGVVQLSGTAKNQAEVDKAGSIAAAVEGVVSVENKIQVAKARRASPAAKASGEERVESRIKDMHAKLAIVQAQEEQWSKVALVMRDNAKQMDALTKSRAEKADMNAIDDLKSYGEITDAHADAIKQFTSIFKTLYDSMSDAQKKNADAVFQRGVRRAS